MELFTDSSMHSTKKINQNKENVTSNTNGFNGIESVAI